MKTAATVAAPAVIAVRSLAGCRCDQYVKVQGTTAISKRPQLTGQQAALASGALTQPERDKLRSIIRKRAG